MYTGDSPNCQMSMVAMAGSTSCQYFSFSARAAEMQGITILSLIHILDYKSILIFAAAFGVTWKWNLHPILLIILAGVAGFLLY